MLLFLLRRVDRRQYEAVKEILSNEKFAVLTINNEEGLTTEINKNLSCGELFALYRKYRKKYFKLKNIYE